MLSHETGLTYSVVNTWSHGPIAVLIKGSFCLNWSSMPPAGEKDDRREYIYDHTQDLLVANPESGVYVFYTGEEREFIRTDIVVEPLEHR